MTHFVTAFTLVDITDSGVSKIRDANTVAYHQQQNLNVLIQSIGLRTQVLDPKVIIHYRADTTKTQFGDFFNNTIATMWQLTFQIEHDGIWSNGTDYFAYLKDDVHGVAITSDLHNTVEFPINIFDTKDNINLYFM